MSERRFDRKKLEVIAEKLKKRNERAFDELFDLTRDYLFYFIFGIVRNDALADDILQDTYITVYEKIDTYRGQNFLSWMMTIAHNKAVNVIRKESRMDTIDPVEQEFLLSESDNEAELMLLKDMSGILNPEEFQIVMMHIIGNYTHKQISNGLEIPIGTVTWRYNEAMKKLRTKLEV